MENAIVTSRSGGLPARRSLGGGGQSAESNALLSLKEALRERLAIIHDEESRRDADAHMARLREVSEKIDKLQAALPRLRSWRIIFSAKVTTKHWNSWKVGTLDLNRPGN